MNDDTARLSMVGHVFRRRWRLLIAFAVVGAAVGAAASSILSPGYEASANVLLQGPREPDELTTEAQVAISSAVLDKVAAGLKWGKSGTELSDSVTAEVAEGNIIQITGAADTPERAQQLADRTANEFVRFSVQLLSDTTDSAAQVSQESQQALRQQVIDTNRRISELHGSAGKGGTIDSVGVRTELESLRSALAESMARIDELDAAASTAKMVVMAPAVKPTSQAPPTMLQLVAGGAALFFLLGLFGHLLVARNDKRLRRESDIAAAAGSSLIAGIDVAVEPVRTAAPGTPLERLRAFLLVDDRPWHVPEPPAAADEHGLDIRYHRVLSRIRERTAGTATRVLVVTARDDALATRAAARLERTAHDDAGPVTVQLAEVSPDRPVVPDDDAVTGVLVVVTTGTRTPWELVGIAEACTDAGHEVLGVLVTHPTRPADAGPRTETPAAAPVETAMAGSA